MVKNKKIVFLVEDDSAIADVYQIMFKKADFNVDVFSSGQESIRAIEDIEKSEREKPDIFIIDLILPDMNGMEILAHIKESNTTKNVPVFISTNQEQTSVDSRGIQPDKFIVKAHITPTQLVELIKKQLKSND